MASRDSPVMSATPAAISALTFMPRLKPAPASGRKPPLAWTASFSCSPL